MSKRLQEILDKLKELGWIDINDYHTDFKFGETNRWVEFDGDPIKYIDIYIYKDEEKYAGYLTVEEFKLFDELMKELSKII